MLKKKTFLKIPSKRLLEIDWKSMEISQENSRNSQRKVFPPYLFLLSTSRGTFRLLYPKSMPILYIYRSFFVFSRYISSTLLFSKSRLNSRYPNL